MKSKKCAAVILMLCLLLNAAACQTQEAIEDTSKQTGQKGNEKKTKKNAESEEETYTFVDVLGESYEAPLLLEVPKSTYDYSRLIEKDGYRYYTDEEGNIISKLGLDVSEFQPQIDWQQVKDAGIEFVMLRMGYRGYGEAGNLALDSKFKEHIEGALSVGLPVGVYFFSQAVSDEEIEEEVQFVLEHIREYEITYPVVFDTEEIKFDVSRTEGMPKEQFTKNCILFCDRMEEAGYDTMIYANMKWFAFTLNLGELTSYDKWYADYEAAPQCPYEFSMWQYTETGSVPGIEGNVDLNVYFGK